MSSPTKRTLALLRKEGWTAQVVEHRVPYTRVTRDLFGCIDVVAVRPGFNGVLGVQATTRANQAARLKKALSAPALRTWLLAGNGFAVWGWAKVGARGKRKLWEATRRAVGVEELPAAEGGGKDQGGALRPPGPAG